MTLTATRVLLVATGLYAAFGAAHGTTSAQASRLSVTIEAPQAAVDLSSAGPVDWVHWGYVALPRIVNRKVTSSPMIGELSRIGEMPFHTFENNPAPYAWTDGTPMSVVPATHSGLFVDGRLNGFSVTALADGQARVLRLYAGYWGAAAPLLEASLSDTSVPPLRREIDPAKDGTKGGHDIYNLVFVVRYQAAPGDTVTLRWTNVGRGNIQLHAASLE